MSIIEKAIDKLKQQQGPEPLHPVGNDEGQSSPERGIGKQKKKSALPLNKERLDELKIVLPGNKDVAEISEDYRRIKRPLLMNAFGKESQLVKDGNLILVTSSLPGEGKSFTTMNLALSIALERDKTVLLIDADMTKSSSSATLGVKDRRGLGDLLQNKKLDIADVLVPTDYPGLTIMPAGAQSNHAAELLASERMSFLIRELAERYDNRIILFDSPPMLNTSETQILAELVGQIVFVVEMGVTSRSAVEQSLQMISDDKAVGLVLNKSARLPAYHYYGGYYGSYYGSTEK